MWLKWEWFPVSAGAQRWFWTKQEMQCSATKGSYILLSWAVGWHTLLLSSVWAVIQKPWQAGAVMFLRVQNQWELWASLCKYNNSGLPVPPLPGFWVLLLLLWEPDSHLFPLLQALPETRYNFSCINVLQPTRFCSNRWEGEGRCGSWPIRSLQGWQQSMKEVVVRVIISWLSLSASLGLVRVVVVGSSHSQKAREKQSNNEKC